MRYYTALIYSVQSPMLRSEFTYDLPDELIARVPAPERRASRLLELDGNSGRLQDRRFADLPDLLRPGDLLVFNDTRVIPARLRGRRESGGKVELLLERLLDGRRAVVQLRASNAPAPGSRLHFGDGVEVVVTGRRDTFFEVEFAGEEAIGTLLDRVGEMPLPPYIDRPVESADRERYQTVYARHDGAVAAPTAGLHFDQAMLEQLAAMGVEQSFVTLHVGAGTYQPVRAERLADHRMHSEWIEVPEATRDAVRATRERGGRVVAVGTTVVRSLESAADGHGGVRPLRGETDIFIVPGYRWQVVDAMITNFHLPESTLLMLICAFAGRNHVLTAYRHAVAAGYRFFSYGDAMFVTRKDGGHG